ncbi:hypothetical protein J5839_05735 [Methanosarcinaceae archaeon]|nr:hypothetical protein [Methanosarcinaceae archaeon]
MCRADVTDAQVIPCAHADVCSQNFGADDQSEDADDRCRITDHGAACGKYADEIRKIPIR